jgi:3',5'-cyclic AMP phosphodiesterase CpdA
MNRPHSFRIYVPAVLVVSLAAAVLLSKTPSARQVAAPVQTVRAISPPTQPLPAEAASAGVTKFSFVAYGDTRGRQDGIALQYEHSMVVDSMVATIKRLASTDAPVRFVLQSGDAVVNGRDPQQWNRSFVDLINRLTVDAGVPYFLAPGNHDVTSSPDLNAAGRQTGLRNYLDAVAKLIPPDGASRRLDGYPTYAFGYGNTFIIALDSNIATDDVQFEWVRKQLEGLDRTRYRNVIAFFHHPPFSSGPHGGPTLEGPTAAIRARYEPLFRQHHVRMTIAGHEHLFEHWVERYDEGGQHYRIDHLVTGGGGAPLYAYQGEPDLRDYLRSGAAQKVSVEHLVKPGPEPGDNPYHYVVVRVDGDDIQLEVIGVDWGKDFRPYRSNVAVLRDGGGSR